MYRAEQPHGAISVEREPDLRSSWRMLLVKQGPDVAGIHADAGSVQAMRSDLDRKPAPR
jgi:hypothetical protein